MHLELQGYSINLDYLFLIIKYCLLESLKDMPNISYSKFPPHGYSLEQNTRILYIWIIYLLNKMDFIKLQFIRTPWYICQKLVWEMAINKTVHFFIIRVKVQHNKEWYK